MPQKNSTKPTGYDKYVNYKTFAIAVGLFAILLAMPLPDSMLDVAVEYSAGKKHVLNYYARELFGKPYAEVEQWQALTARVLEKSMAQGALSRKTARAITGAGVLNFGWTGIVT